MEHETTVEKTPATVTHLIKFEVTPEQIRKMGEQYAALTFDTPEAYEEGRKALATLRATRKAIEERRVELKASALEWGRKVDGQAKELTALIVTVEEPLKAKKSVIDEEKERAKREAAEAERRALEEKIRAEQEAAEAKRKELLAAEERRLEEQRAALEADRARLAEEQRVAAEKAAAEQKAAADKLAEERRAFEAEQAKAAADREAERELAAMEERARQTEIEQRERSLTEERQRVEEQRAAAERAEEERQARIRAEDEAKAQAERDRIAAEEERVAELARQERERARLEAIKPDVERVHAFAAAIRALRAPEVKSAEAKAALDCALEQLGCTALELDEFGAVEQAPPAHGRLVGADRGAPWA